ncbi:MAG: hypothetical protein M3Q45_00635, partial [Chloroflexota bacterium]|nr:hypothetical protein [Chloroflexota bacterium]
ACAVARTLADDVDGYWGGSIEFRHFGEPTLLEVADGISLPVTTDGQLLGYSIARNADCAAWATCNLVYETRGLMTDKDRAVALELLGDETLVAQLAARLGDKNRTLDGAITYTVEEPTTSETIVDSPMLTDAPVEYELDEAAVATLTDVVMQRAVTPLVDERTGALRSHVDDVMAAFTSQVATATAQLTQLETRIEARLATLELGDQARYQQYDQARPPQRVIKLGVRPRGVATNSPTAKTAQWAPETGESEFARKAREKRQKA